MNISRDELKKVLTQIRENDYKVPEGMKPYELTLVMLEHLGDIDMELRDRLIYAVIFKWSVGGVYTKEQLKQMMAIIVDDKHLFHGIGEMGTDSVFMRAFSVLLAAIGIYLHRQDAYLTPGELRNIKDSIIDYMDREKDVRGYVEVGGWAHSAAHSADTVDELAQCEELGREELLQILQAVQKKVCIDYHAYICLEDERLSVAVNSLINRNVLSEAEVAEWIRSFGDIKVEKIMPQRFYLISNMRNFLNSLFYRLPEGKYDTIRTAISETILKVRPF